MLGDDDDDEEEAEEDVSVLVSELLLEAADFAVARDEKVEEVDISASLLILLAQLWTSLRAFLSDS